MATREPHWHRIRGQISHVAVGKTLLSWRRRCARQKQDLDNEVALARRGQGVGGKRRDEANDNYS